VTEARPGAELLLGGGAAQGWVRSFDKDVGLGEVATETASPGSGVGKVTEVAVFPFHCTEIAGGSRDIEIGTRVSFVVVPGHQGRWEARSITQRD